jgi:recombination protein RecT
MASATETLKEQAGLVKKPMTIHDKLQSMTPQIAAALPRHLSAERMIRIGLTCLRTNPALLECSMQSVMASIMIAAQLGLEPGVLGQCFLIPYKQTCQLVPGWLGILDMVNRAGKATAWTGAVYAGDEFDWALGDKPYVTHRPSGNETALTHVYAIARVKGMEYPIVEVWSVQKVIAHRDKYNKVGGNHYSYKHMEMYSRKVALLQVLKYIPRSIELATAFNLDASAEMGTQQLEIKDVPSIIEGSLVPEPREESAPIVGPVFSPKLDEQAQTPAKEGPTLCSECRQIGKHAADCKYAEQQRVTSKPTNQALYLIKSVAKKQKKDSKEPYFVLTVMSKGPEGDTEGKLYVWHQHLHEHLAGKKEVMLIGEVSEQRTKDGKSFYQLEHVSELAGQKFVDDKPVTAEAAMTGWADLELEQELFGQNA